MGSKKCALFIMNALNLTRERDPVHVDTKDRHKDADFKGLTVEESIFKYFPCKNYLAISLGQYRMGNVRDDPLRIPKEVYH